LIRLNSSSDLASLHRAGGVLSAVLAAARRLAVPGARPIDLARAIERSIGELGAEPMLPSLRNARGEAFPAAASICVNDEASGAPPSGRTLCAGDLVTIDSALRLSGWCADAASSIVIPSTQDDEEPAAADRARVLERSRRVIAAALMHMKPGVAWSRIAHAARQRAMQEHLTIVPGLGGHGVGLQLHEPPTAGFCQEKARDAAGQDDSVPQDFTLQRGMVLTLEPVLTSGDGRVREEPDAWTLRSCDGSPCVSEELMVEIAEAGARILAGGPEWMSGELAANK
jgi:methionyl aminopeptidase